LASVGLFLQAPARIFLIKTTGILFKKRNFVQKDSCNQVQEITKNLKVHLKIFVLIFCGKRFELQAETKQIYPTQAGV
jgi:hypothetical protein